MKLSQEEKDFLFSSLRKYFPDERTKLLLFGSYAKGQAKSTSDIDIAIQDSGPVDPAQWQKAISFFEDSTFLKKVDQVDYHRVSFDFKKIIDRDGTSLS